MKSIIFFSVFVAANIAFGAQQFECPVLGQNRSVSDMYDAMAHNLVWGANGQDRNPIIFVDEENELKDANGQLTPIGKTFVVNGEFDFRGSFKIGYDYKAKECRRQIVLQEQVSPGVYTGYTAIEICNPRVAGVFYKAKAKNFDDLYNNVFKVEGEKARKAADEIMKPINEERQKVDNEINKLYDKVDNDPLCHHGQPTFNQQKCDDLYNDVNAKYDELMEKHNTTHKAGIDKANALYSQSDSLLSLKINDQQKPYVSYFKDKDGYVLPRFKVDLSQFYYQRRMARVWGSGANGGTKHIKTCVMDIIHATSYAGLAGRYAWDFNYETGYKGKTWTFDQNGNSVEKQQYQIDLKDFDILDINKYFFIK